MNGLVIVSGVNFAGKTTTMKLIKEQWGAHAEYISSSQDFLRRAGEHSYKAFQTIPQPEIKEIREEMFKDIAMKARFRPVFFDTHFVVGKDNETIDYLPFFKDVIKRVIMVNADVQDIERRRTYALRADHPNHEILTSHFAIKDLIRQESYAARVYALRAGVTAGYIFNNTDDIENLREKVSYELPRIRQSIEGAPRLELVGRGKETI